MLRRVLFLLPMLCLLLASLACQQARMAVPSELAVAAQTIKVKQTMVSGWDAPFDFGPYHVSRVQRGWTESTAWGFLGYEDYKAKQSYQFAIKSENGKPWQCNCATKVSQQVLESMVSGEKLTWELGAGENLACTLLGPKGEMWRMALAASGRARAVMRGLLKGPQLNISVEGTDKLEGTSLPMHGASGYVFWLKTATSSGLLGAVQVINNGLLWLPQSPERDVLAAASAALLLHQNVDRKN
ncbi:MAG: hypothetical protein KQH53_07325 [Desulfarculaceae bacterium]|nr:hypothetical protein [Desulfarculaceae bacterium]